jgi:hypothetical protein
MSSHGKMSTLRVPSIRSTDTVLSPCATQHCKTSSLITAVQSTYMAGETTLCDNSSEVQSMSSDLPPPRLDLGPPQRRRVNPESLAARLGPELVAEMEKHIIPGSIEMPPFSVRRDIQIKFGIDRRHIYDFFHSRGLRCLNERAVRNNCLEVWHSVLRALFYSLTYSWAIDEISKTRSKRRGTFNLSRIEEAQSRHRRVRSYFL